MCEFEDIMLWHDSKWTAEAVSNVLDNAVKYPNIFKRFYRDSIPEVENTEGTGIGLYLVHQILERQGGSVCASASGKRGTVIKMMLPAKYRFE